MLQPPRSSIVHSFFGSGKSLANFAATVNHGLPLDLHKPIFQPRGGYVAFLGRISPEKGPERAIEIARALGVPLKIAAKIDKVDESYFEAIIKPILDGAGVEFIGAKK